ncbi:hypothetical protein BB559_002800 [Furculomyces boomerangus]|uniref:Uncharacterized protein n=1 Tax=Furculomyces boomerangus TaxID=61424 RepID=A0A2T9YSH7_9FUNG|nr:hypothetical protein BB559_002800 [Furculomyces boomerangus]
MSITNFERLLSQAQETELILSINPPSEEIVDDESSSPDVVFDSLTEANLITLTNFSFKDFDFLYSILNNDLAKMRSPKGKKSKLSEKDSLLFGIWHEGRISSANNCKSNPCNKENIDENIFGSKKEARSNQTRD